MRLAFAFASMLLVGLVAPEHSAAAVDDDADNLVGVWKLESFSLQVLGEQPTEIFGQHPIGYLILTVEGRMMTIITRADRKPATTVNERAALLDSMVSYTGRYKVEHDRIIIRPDVAWNEIYSGTEQIRYYTLNGDKLSVRTGEQLSAVLPGKRVVGTLTYKRE
jgi:hypothetical protein